MNILFYSYECTYETPLGEIFASLGIDVHYEHVPFESKGTCSGETVQKLASKLLSQIENGSPYLFVFSVNFFPAISEICQKFNTPYVSWTVDNPVMELFTNSIKNKCNRIFMFDKAQYQRLHKYNPEGIFYLPLGADIRLLNKAVISINENDQSSFSHDIAFVGSLYTKDSGLYKLDLDEFTNGFIDGLIESQLQVYGYNFMESSLPVSIIEKIKGAPMDPNPENFVEPIDAYTASQFLIAKKLAEVERHRILNNLGNHFNVDVYTNSDASGLSNVNLHPPIKNYIEVPKVYKLSKINLNLTLRSIETGIPLRVFEVLASGGFLITNYQEEIADLFEIGRELEVFTCEEELIEKCQYYLSHEEERIAIAKRGLNKVINHHSLQYKIKEILSKV